MVMELELSDLYRDYAYFHRVAIATRDVDPTYPVYVALADRLGLDEGGRAWLVFLHVGYYHMGSALAAYAAARSPADAALAPVNLPKGTERRSYRWRPEWLTRYLRSVYEAARRHGGNLHAWAAADLPDEPRAAWAALTRKLLTLAYTGRWAAFKAAEMLQQVCGLPVAAPDMGHAFSTGPRRGLALLYPGLPDGHGAKVVAVLDGYSERLLARLRADGLPATMEQAETTLCDFHALTEGRYYVGHDIDLMLQQLFAVQSRLTTVALEARADALPHAYLGELNGWAGVDRRRCGHYRRTGEVLVR